MYTDSIFHYIPRCLKLMILNNDGKPPLTKDFIEINTRKCTAHK